MTEIQLNLEGNPEDAHKPAVRYRNAQALR